MNKTIEDITWKFSPPLEFPCMRCRENRAEHQVKIYTDPGYKTIFFQAALCFPCACLPVAVLWDDLVAVKSRASGPKTP